MNDREHQKKNEDNNQGKISSSSASSNASAKIHSNKVNVFYGSKQALFEISLDIPENHVTRVNRAFRVRKINFFALPQSHE